jgi:hypothetical protein
MAGQPLIDCFTTTTTPTRKRAMSDTTWYAVYEYHPVGGYDADYVPFDTREEAQAEAETYLEFATGAEDAVYIVEVPNAAWEAAGEEWSLWDCLGDFAPVYLHLGSERYEIVDDLRSLADAGVNEGVLLRQAADEIVRLRRAVERG